MRLRWFSGYSVRPLPRKKCFIWWVGQTVRLLEIKLSSPARLKALEALISYFVLSALKQIRKMLILKLVGPV